MGHPVQWRQNSNSRNLDDPPQASMLDLVRSAPGGVLMPRQFTNMAEAIYNFELRPDDVFVVTYPKCGTTWTQEMVWQILHDMDVEGGRRESIMTRSPYLEMQVNNTSTDLVLLIEVGMNCFQKLRHIGCLATDLAQIWWTYDHYLGQKSIKIFYPNPSTDGRENVSQTQF